MHQLVNAYFETDVKTLFDQSVRIIMHYDIGVAFPS